MGDNIVGISGTGGINTMSVNPDGSINTTATIGSISLAIDSVYVQSGTIYQVSGNTTIVGGSVQTFNPLGIGSVLVTNNGSESVITAGSIQTYDAIGIGSVLVTNNGSESVITAGSIQTYNPVGIGSVLVSNNGSEAVITAGSVETYGTNKTRPDSAVFGFDAGTAAGSRLVLSPAAGSTLVITDLMISSQAANLVSLFESGISTTLYGQFYFAANGGAVSNLNTGIKLANAGSQLYISQTAAGSVTISATGYSE